MANTSSALRIVIVIFAVIGVIGMWVMHSTMIGRMSGSGIGQPMASICNGMMAAPDS